MSALTSLKRGFHGIKAKLRGHANQAAVTLTTGAVIPAFTDPPSAAEMAVLRTRVNTIIADNIALAALGNEIRTALIGKGIIKGAA